MSSVFLNMVDRTRNAPKKYRGQFCYVIKILFHQTILTPRYADVILVWAETIKLFSFDLTGIFGLFSLVLTFQKIAAELCFKAWLNLYITLYIEVLTFLATTRPFKTCLRFGAILPFSDLSLSKTLSSALYSVGGWLRRMCLSVIRFSSFRLQDLILFLMFFTAIWCLDRSFLLGGFKRFRKTAVNVSKDALVPTFDFRP